MGDADQAMIYDEMAVDHGVLKGGKNGGFLDGF